MKGRSTPMPLYRVPSTDNDSSSGLHPPVPRPPPRHHRRASSAALLNEWTEDADVRDLYGAAMPADLPEEDVAALFRTENNANQHPVVSGHSRRDSFRRWWGTSSLGQVSEDESESSSALLLHPSSNTEIEHQQRRQRAGQRRQDKTQEPLLVSQASSSLMARESTLWGGQWNDATGEETSSLRGESLLDEHITDVV